MIWDAKTWQELRKLSPQGKGEAPIRSTFSPDGRFVALGLEGGDTAHAEIWDVETGRLLARTEHLNSVWAVVFSPDGRRFASASRDKTAVIAEWNADEARLENPRIVKHDAAIISAAFSADGAFLLTGSEDESLRVWEAETGLLVRAFSLGSAVRRLAVHPQAESRTFFVGTADGTIHRLRLPEPALLRFPQEPLALLFSRDGETLYLGGIGWVEARATKTLGQSAWTRALPAGVRLERLVLSPDGARLSGAASDGLARIWDTVSGKELATFPHDAPLAGVVFEANGKSLLTSETDRYSLQRWSTEEPARKLPMEFGFFSFAALGERIFAGAQQGKIHELDSTLQVRRTFRTGHENSVRTLAISQGLRMETMEGMG